MRLRRRTSAIALTALVAALAVPTAAHADGSATYTGTVVTSDGTAVADLPVSFRTATGSDGSTSTDSTGAFSLAVPTGDVGWLQLGEEDLGKIAQNRSFDTVVRYIGGTTASGASTAYTEASAALTAGVSKDFGALQVDRPGSVTGTDPRLANADLKLESVVGSRVDSVTADSSGHYTITDVVPGSYRLHVYPYYPRQSILESTSAVFHVAAGPASTTFVPTVKPAAQVTGTVTIGHKRAKAAVAVAAEGSTGDSSYAGTDSRGAYALTGLSGGAYTVQFSNDASASTSTFIGAHRSVKVKPGTTTHLSIDLEKAGSVTGRVHLQKGVSTQVTVETANGTVLGTASTDAKGRYTFGGLGSGHYRVLGATAARYAERTVRVKLGRVTHVSTLTPKRHTLKLRGSLSPSTHGYITLAASDDRGVRYVETSKAGDFTVAGLVPGRYQILADTDGTTGSQSTLNLTKSVTRRFDAGVRMQSVTVTLTRNGAPYVADGIARFSDGSGGTATFDTTDAIVVMGAPGTTYTLQYVTPNEYDEGAGPMWLAPSGSATFTVPKGHDSSVSFDLTAQYGD